MFEMTKRHVTVLDPTSKETSMHASENMTVTSRPDWKFGLGMGVDADVVDHYSAKYPDVTAKEAARAEAKAAAARAVAVPSGGARGKTQLPEPSAASVRLMAMEAAARHEAVDELLEADAEGLWEDDVEGVETSKAKAKANPYGLRELSVLEKKYLSDAAGRQKANQIVKQVVGGKEWKGAPFLCKPAELLFADFEVGNTYELKFTMTNVSYSFNAFRPQDLPIAVASFFDLTHVPPGRMSAGVSAPLTVTFTPKVNEDIDSAITFHTATGPMTVPLKATTRKANIALPVSTIDFGFVVMGEERVLPIVIHNGGALECPLTFSVLHMTQPPEEEGEAVEGADEERSSGSPVFTVLNAPADKPIQVRGYSTTTVMVRFAPRLAGDAACLYKMSFGGVAPDEEVSVHGMGVEVPIYLSRELIDMQCCAYDGLYRENVVLNNRSKVSHKVQLRVPPALQGFLEFVPSMGYVQARSAFTVSMKLRTGEELLTTCAEMGWVADGCVLSVPITVGVPEQVLPVTFTLRAQLTTPVLSLERFGTAVSRLDFGSCPLSATRVLKLELRNPSALPQRFGFLPLPKGLDVQPGDGLGTILPGETIEREVHFSPSAATQFNATLTCRTSLNRTYTLKCLGQGVLSGLTMSHSKLSLPPTAEGDLASGDITLINTSAAPQTFEFAPPVGSGLKLAPAVGTIPPDGSMRVLVEFTAPVNPDPHYRPYGASGNGTPADAAGGEGGEGGGEEGGGEEGAEGAAAAPEEAAAAAEGEEGAEGEEAPAAAEEEAGPLLAGCVASGAGEPWTLLARPTVACYVREEGKPYSVTSTLYLGVETAVVAVPVVLGASDSVRQDLAFGSVPVGEIRMKAVLLVSRSDVPIDLSAEPLDELGPFSLINAMPQLPPRGSVEVFVRFAPSRQLPGRETLTIHAAGATVKVALTGQGVSPTLRILPPPAEAPPAAAKGAPPAAAEGAPPPAKVRLGGGRSCTLVHVADLLVGDEGSKTVTLENTSEFALRYTLVSQSSGHANEGALPPFDVTPCEATIEGGASIELTVLFSPDHASASFWNLVEVSVPNQEAEPHLLMLRGRATACAGYVLAPEQLVKDGAALLGVPPRDLLGLPTGGETAGEPKDEARQIEISLVPSGPEGVGSAELVIGHAKANKLDVKPAALEFSFEGLDDEASRRGFSVEPIKGVVKEGEQQIVTLSFAQKEEALAGTELGVIASFGVSQWAEVWLKCILKGGNPLPTQPETTVLLKGYIAGRSVAS